MKRERLLRNPQTGEMEWVAVGRPSLDPRKTYSTAYSTPLVSRAAGCHSSQINEFNEFYKQQGITGARHLANGDCEFSDENARNRVLQVRGLYDRDAGYRQWTGSEKD